MTGTMKTMEDALDSIIMEALVGTINTAIPAIVTAFDGHNRVTVQPIVKRKYVGQSPTPLPPIEDVPIMFPGAGEYFFTFEIPVGSWVLLIISQRSIESWKNSPDGEVGEAKTPRKWSFSDAVAVPGLVPFPKFAPVTVAPGIQLRNLLGDVTIGIDGSKITMKNSAGTFEMDDLGKVSINGNFTVDV
jgi:hypothetical protein